MKKFTRKEFILVIIIFLTVFGLTFRDLRVSIRRARDSQRSSDLTAIANGLEQFQKEYGFFPPSEDGKIKACKADNFPQVLSEVQKKNFFDRTLFISGLRTCEWGKDSLNDPVDDTRQPYITVLPTDPETAEGIRYLYESNMNRYQLFAYLEGESSESEFNERISGRNLNCGSKNCNTGKSYANTRLDITIQEYEQELLKK